MTPDACALSCEAKGEAGRALKAGTPFVTGPQARKQPGEGKDQAQGFQEGVGGTCAEAGGPFSHQDTSMTTTWGLSSPLSMYLLRSLTPLLMARCPLRPGAKNGVVHGEGEDGEVELGWKAREFCPQAHP